MSHCKNTKKNRRNRNFFPRLHEQGHEGHIRCREGRKNNRCQPWAAHGPQRNAQDLGKTPSVPIFPTF